eukprot:snap_masked-scaffold_64-processed-gene-0.60-mRNA-1 protein AED:1.00 eAED:1.00 QI:0/-1/0/0/-1/1/1/0/180
MSNINMSNINISRKLTEDSGREQSKESSKEAREKKKKYIKALQELVNETKFRESRLEKIAKELRREKSEINYKSVLMLLKSVDCVSFSNEINLLELLLIDNEKYTKLKAEQPEGSSQRDNHTKEKNRLSAKISRTKKKIILDLLRKLVDFLESSRSISNDKYKNAQKYATRKYNKRKFKK